MTWEQVAIFATAAVIFMIVVLWVALMIALVMEAKTKREIELHKAGLMPPGWVRGK